MLYDNIGNKVEDIPGESSDISGWCVLEIEFKNGDRATLNITMEDEDGNEK